MSEIDQQFIEYVVKSLVGKPDAVKVERRIDEKGVLLELTVDPEDLGRVIGKRGATAQSLRTLLRALGTKNDARYNLKIVDNGEGGSQRTKAPESDRPSDKPSDDAPADNSTAPSSDDTAPQADDNTSDDVVEDAAEDEPPAEPAESPEPPAEDSTPAQEETTTSDRLAQTRQELADLDDLDL